MAGTELHFPTLRQILVPKEQLDLEAYLQEQQEKHNQALATLSDSLAYMSMLADSSDCRFWFPNNDNTFFDSLFFEFEQTISTGRTIRILHYGDSQIEIDHISSRLRAYMQQTFGGGGPGLIPIAPIVGTPSVSHYANGNLTLLSSFGDSTAQRSNGNYGVMMQCHHLSGSANAGIRATLYKNSDDRLKTFSSVKVLFNNRPGPLSISFSNGESYSVTSAGVHLISTHGDSLSTLQMKLAGNADIYGVMVDNGSGVSVDNIPMRGCSGQQFCLASEQLLTDAYALMDVGLIIMQFGGNSVSYIRDQKRLQTYCTSLGRQIQHVHRCCPHAKILFIGPSDMCTTIHGNKQTYPFLPEFIDGLRQMALDNGAAYWSIYDAMGGMNSMVAWVGNGYTGSDHLHFTQKGADIMGDRLANAFDMMYQLYKIRKATQQLASENHETTAQ